MTLLGNQAIFRPGRPIDSESLSTSPGAWTTTASDIPMIASWVSVRVNQVRRLGCVKVLSR